jgi:hypothetical protein
MKRTSGTPHGDLTPALEAIGNLAVQELNEIFYSGQMAAMSAHDEIELAPINRKTSLFYWHLLPLRKNLVSLLADNYRRYFKLALAHPREAERDPHQWAWIQLRPFVDAVLEQICNWYIRACDDATAPFPPPNSWRAPAWLFQVSLAHVGVGPLKTKNVPTTDSEQRLGAALTRLLLKGARRVFLWELAVAIERVRNEEIAAAGASPSQTVGGPQTGEPKKPKYWSKGTAGLTPKTDLSRYKKGLTEKQELAFSLKYEYQVGPAEIAARMGIDRKTAYEHIEAADRKIKQLHSSEKREANRAKNTPDL